MNAIIDTAEVFLPIGVLPHMTAETYHEIPAMSAGGLRRMVKTPAHFFGLQLDPERPPPGEPTPAMANGTLVHCACFEPDELDKRYVVKPAGHDGRTTQGKAWVAANVGRIVVSAAELQAARAQAAALRRLPDVGKLLANGMPEVSAFWVDERTGELCKCRPDFVSPAGDGVILVDGKTCQDASPDGFSRTVWNMRYDLAAAWYIDGYAKSSGLPVYGYVFACVESSWPHIAAAYMLNDEVIDQARTESRRLLDLYAQCKRTGNWPGYASDIQPIGLPRWAAFKEPV